jgi:hypothetical protein
MHSKALFTIKLEQPHPCNGMVANASSILEFHFQESNSVVGPGADDI